MIETVFVTGGSSTLGEHVLRRLISHFHVLAVVHRHKVEIPDAEIELLHGGLEETVRNPRTLQKAQVVLHMAAVTHAEDPAEYFHVNAELTNGKAVRPSILYMSAQSAHTPMAAPMGAPNGSPKKRSAAVGWIIPLSGRRKSMVPGMARGSMHSLQSHEKSESCRTFGMEGRLSMRRSACRKLRTLLRRQQFVAVRQDKLILFALIVYSALPRWPKRSAAPCVLSLLYPCRS